MHSNTWFNYNFKNVLEELINFKV